MQNTLLAFVDDSYEDLELWYPKLRLEEAGYAMRLAAPEIKTYRGKHGYPAKSDLLLKLAHPDYHGALQQKLRVNAEKIRRDNAATSFDIRTVRAAPDALAAVLTGQLKVLINGTPVKNEIRHYLARFDLDGGKAQLIQFKQVKNDDVKAALADAALDDETDGNF